jgi:hypothetical protein
MKIYTVHVLYDTMAVLCIKTCHFEWSNNLTCTYDSLNLFVYNEVEF